MKSSDFAKVSKLMRDLAQLEGEVNGADATVSFTDGRTVTVPMDKNLGAGYVNNARNNLKNQLSELGVEIEA